jgi:KUP system potassium uptake protein
MTIRHTSPDQSGQIYIGAVNWMLLAGVAALVLSFGTSAALASAYGIAVTGTMVVTTLLAIVYITRSGKLALPLTLLVAAPILLLELAFLASNLTKLHEGGYVPLLIAALIMLAMLAWWRGSQQLLAHTHRQAIALNSFADSMLRSSAPVVPGTAFFLTPDPTVVPSALLHNLKHNRVLHEQNVLVTVETLRIPMADPAERASYEVINPRFARLTLRFGFMETPNVTRAMIHARRAGLKFDVMASSFFLGKRRPVVTGPIGLDRLLDSIYALLARFSADPSDFYHLPRNRVVELGERVAV